MQEESQPIKERRRFKRIKVNFMLVYRVEEPLELRIMIGVQREICALMLDLSEEGMGILTDYDIPRGAIILIKFTLIDSDSLSEKFINMDIRGKVIYNLSLERSEHRVGIHFEKIEPEHRYKIHNFVEKYFEN